MPTDGPVKINHYTIFAIIPFLDLYAAYQIKKFRLYFLISWIGGWGLSTLIQMLLPFPYGLIGGIAAEIIISVYLLRRWAKQWNNQFENTGVEN